MSCGPIVARPVTRVESAFDQSPPRDVRYHVVSSPSRLVIRSDPAVPVACSDRAAPLIYEAHSSEIRDPQAHLCLPRLDVLAGSLTWNSYLGRFLLIGEKQTGTTGMFFYSLSNDLVHWTSPRLLMGVELSFTHGCGDPDPKAYASFIDPASPSRSFDVTGRRGWLYYTQFNYRNCQMTLDRDLVRVPVELTVEP